MIMKLIVLTNKRHLAAGMSIFGVYPNNLAQPTLNLTSLNSFKALEVIESSLMAFHFDL